MEDHDLEEDSVPVAVLVGTALLGTGRMENHWKEEMKSLAHDEFDGDEETKLIIEKEL